MAHEEIVLELLGIVRRLDRRSLEITPQILVFTELDFDSLQMMELIESIKIAFGVDLLTSDDLLRDFRTPEAMAAAIANRLEHKN